jgi:8-oxo-dGTP pyrophosphatase MutT (NUDIX family)
MAALPPPGSVVERVTARVLPVNPAGRVLLLHGWEPSHPDQTFWFTIGGAVEDGEDLVDAAVWELAEEVGIRVESSRLEGPIGTWSNAFAWGGWQIRQQETWYVLAVDDIEVIMDGMDDVELETTDTAGWWTPDELDADGSAVIPELTSRMRTAIALVR